MPDLPRPDRAGRPIAAAAPDVSGLRAVTDDDATALIDLIGGAYAEHPGCVLDLPGVDADLDAPAASIAAAGGRWWVVDRDGVVASVACVPAEHPRRMVLERLYVAPTQRRRGLAGALVEVVEHHASGLGADEMELWSDTRFIDAHRLYAGLGYRRTGEARDLHDPSETTEWRFVRTLRS